MSPRNVPSRIFQTRIKVRFGDVDRAGIAYYPRIVGYFHYAFEEFWESFARKPYHQVLNKDHLGFPTVHMEVDFVKPVSFGDVLTAKVSIPRMGRSSVVFRYDLYRRKTLCVTADLTLVAVDMRRFKPRSIPAWCRKLFRRCAS